MENLNDNEFAEEVTTSEVDEAMLEMNEFIAQMTDIDGYLYDWEASTTMRMDSLDLSIPIELDLKVRDDGSVVLGGSPPLYYTETTILPVFHQLTIKLKLNDNDNTDHNGGIRE